MDETKEVTQEAAKAPTPGELLAAKFLDVVPFYLAAHEVRRAAFCVAVAKAAESAAPEELAQFDEPLAMVLASVPYLGSA